jgi:hypothetical protein
MRVALVTGSAKGIGRAILLALAREGFAVAVHYRTSEGLAEATRQEAEALGVRAIKVRADLTREEEVAGLVEEVRYHLGGVGVLVNNVGDYLYKPIEEVSLEEWRWILDTNLTATFLLTQKVLPLMVEQGYGRIVNLGYAGASNLLARPTSRPTPSPRPEWSSTPRPSPSASLPPASPPMWWPRGGGELHLQAHPGDPHGAAGPPGGDRPGRPLLRPRALPDGAVLEVVGGWNL